MTAKSTVDSTMVANKHNVTDIIPHCAAKSIAPACTKVKGSMKSTLFNLDIYFKDKKSIWVKQSSNHKILECLRFKFYNYNWINSFCNIS